MIRTRRIPPGADCLSEVNDNGAAPDRDFGPEKSLVLKVPAVDSAYGTARNSQDLPRSIPRTCAAMAAARCGGPMGAGCSRCDHCGPLLPPDQSGRSAHRHRRLPEVEHLGATSAPWPAAARHRVVARRIFHIGVRNGSPHSGVLSGFDRRRSDGRKSKVEA
jgi:hypothetical protein